MASTMAKAPETLYDSSISAIVNNYAIYKKELGSIHGNVLFDIYYKMYRDQRFYHLKDGFSKLDIFGRLLRIKDKRCPLHNCFQALVENVPGLIPELVNSYQVLCTVMPFWCKAEDLEKIIQLGFLLGDFLADAGWFEASEKIMKSCFESLNNENFNYYALECYIRLLHARGSYCKFERAQEIFLEAQEFVARFEYNGMKVNLSGLYSEFSSFYSACSDRKEAYQWSVAALRQINLCKNPKVIVKVLAQASKACVLQRRYKAAGILIKQALLICKKNFGTRDPVMASTLLDYGFYLLNVDSIPHSIKVYQTALEIRQCIFGGRNLLVAIAHEDLAYAFYVQEYSTGKFRNAKDHAEKALEMMESLLPENHLLLSSIKRVKALVLEEIAIDNQDEKVTESLLQEAHDLHLYALRLAQEVHGETNVQTAKHYGNLGRLYQSMKKFEDAREMHLKAIAIKESILGPEDYEVALSIGHLASLYSYDMNLFEEAEKLYLRSINIGLKVFGEGYSGLVYDYQGLMRVYQHLNNQEQVYKYLVKLYEWKTLREQTSEAENGTSPLKIMVELIPLDMLYLKVDRLL